MKGKEPHYFNVREIKTGRCFKAEYDRESAAYYEKGTGKEFNITEVETLSTDCPEATQRVAVYDEQLSDYD